MKSVSTATAPVTGYVSNSGRTWRLKDYAKVWSFGSRVYIKWSNKLGLSIEGQTPERAKLLVQQVLAKGVIRPDLWDKTFYPDWSFGSVTYMD